ncbi:MAG TPA: L,D-transpeptidase family protein [Candidatus Sumerlaeota bacterium]|nr:L,D-transpeptidase family protein [Candidatus Sumerlaeota bacterium]
MASIKTTFTTILILLILVALGVVGVFGYHWWQVRAVQGEIAQARTLLDTGSPQEAEQILATRMERSKPGQPWVAQIISMRFEAMEAYGDDAAAQRLAALVLSEGQPWVRPPQEAWAQATLRLAQAELARNNIQGAQGYVEAVLAQPASQPVKDEAELAQARIELAQGKAEEAKARLEALLARVPEGSPVRRGVEHNLGLLNTRMLLSPQPFGEDELYVVAKGDTIAGIAKRFGVSPDLIMRVNGIENPRMLSIGRRLKIPKLDLELVVNKTDNTLTVYNGGKFFKRYDVRTGEYDYQTPPGEYRIQNKKENPAWTDPKTNEHYEPNAPGNQLGSRWMGFSGSLGIHEAIDAESIGTYSSNGCVGLVKQDVEELYDLVRVGTPVRIVGQKSTPSL